MTKKVNPQLFRIKNYNFINSPYTNFFDSVNQFYLIKRNIFFFIKYFKKFKFFIFYFKIQRNLLNKFKVFFFGYFLKQNRHFFLTSNFFYLKNKKKRYKRKKNTLLIKNFLKVLKKHIKNKNLDWKKILLNNNNLNKQVFLNTLNFFKLKKKKNLIRVKYLKFSIKNFKGTKKLYIKKKIKIKSTQLIIKKKYLNKKTIIKKLNKLIFKKNNLIFFKNIFSIYFKFFYNLFNNLKKKKKNSKIFFFKKLNNSRKLFWYRFFNKTFIVKKKYILKTKKKIYLKKKKVIKKKKKVILSKINKKKKILIKNFTRFNSIKKKLNFFLYLKPLNFSTTHNFDIPLPKKLLKFQTSLKKNLFYKQKLIFNWYVLNNKQIKNKIFWNNYINNISKKSLFQFQFLIKKPLNLKWKFKFKKKLIFNIKGNFKYLKLKKKNIFLKVTKNLLFKKFNNNNNFLYFKNVKYKFFFFKYLLIKNKLKKKIKIKKKMFEKNSNFLFNKLFFPFTFNIFLKVKLNKKKLNFLKFIFFNIYKHHFFKIFNFYKQQYFLSFLYLIWYKDLSFLSFSVYNSFLKVKNGERFVIKNFKSFLKSLLLVKYGIIGIKFMLKGKLFKKRRKKIISFNKGSINLISLNKDIKFINYDIFTRAGAYNFKCWISFR
jgi:hypothetical protein